MGICGQAAPLQFKPSGKLVANELDIIFGNAPANKGKSGLDRDKANELINNGMGYGWSMNSVFWAALSRKFAEDASGEVHVFLPEHIDSTGLFATVELPTLRSNPKVRWVVAHILKKSAHEQCKKSSREERKTIVLDYENWDSHVVVSRSAARQKAYDALIRARKKLGVLPTKQDGAWAQIRLKQDVYTIDGLLAACLERHPPTRDSKGKWPAYDEVITAVRLDAILDKKAKAQQAVFKANQETSKELQSEFFKPKGAPDGVKSIVYEIGGGTMGRNSTDVDMDCLVAMEQSVLLAFGRDAMRIPNLVDRDDQDHPKKTALATLIGHKALQKHKKVVSLLTRIEKVLKKKAPTCTGTLNMHWIESKNRFMVQALQPGLIDVDLLIKGVGRRKNLKKLYEETKDGIRIAAGGVINEIYNKLDAARTKDLHDFVYLMETLYLMLGEKHAKDKKKEAKVAMEVIDLLSDSEEFKSRFDERYESITDFKPMLMQRLQYFHKRLVGFTSQPSGGSKDKARARYKETVYTYADGPVFTFHAESQKKIARVVKSLEGALKKLGAKPLRPK